MFCANRGSGPSMDHGLSCANRGSRFERTNRGSLAQSVDVGQTVDRHTEHESMRTARHIRASMRARRLT